MTLKGIKRLKVIEMTIAKQLRCEETAKNLGISEWHFYRISKRYEESGEQGLAHASRGRSSPRRISAKIREQIDDLLEAEYADYKSQHLLEVLEAKYHFMQ